MIMNFLQEVHNGNIENIQGLIESRGIPVDAKWSDYILLRYALWRGQKDIAKLLIEKGCRINKTCKTSSNTPLHIAVKQEDAELVDILLESGASVEARNHHGETPLHFAAKSKNDRIIDLLLAKINCTDDSKFIERHELIPLHIACMKNDSSSVEILLKSGASANMPVALTSPFWPSYTPLHFAVEYERCNTVQILLEHGADISAKDSRGLTALHLAVEMKNLDIMDLILKAHKLCEENINPVDSRGFSHFHAACMRFDKEVVMCFLDKGVKINSAVDSESPSWPGYTPLHFAVEFESTEIVKLLLDHDADISIKNLRGLTPLHFAIQRENKDITDMILHVHISNYKNINPTDNRGFSHFHAACMRNEPNVVEAFLQNGVEINCPVNLESPNWPGYTPLHFAVENKCVETVNLLLRHGAIVSVRDSKGMTPLHLATLYLHEKILKMLLESGADVNVQTKIGLTPLHIAVERGYFSVVQILLRHNADVNCIETLKSSTPLHLATLYKRLDIAELLLTSGANADVREKDGKTALHTMALRDPRKELDMELVKIYSKIITVLLDYGCNVDSQDTYGRTPLHMTCLYRNLAGAYALLHHGADINLEDSIGKTPLSYCMHVFHNIYYIFQDHIEKLKFINFFVSEKNEACYMKLRSSYKRLKRKWRDEEHAEEFPQGCEDELNRMRSIRIDNYTSLYDIIFRSPNEMALHVRNDRLTQLIKSHSFDETFSLYGYLIKLQFKKGLAREVLMEPAKDSLQTLIGIRLPDLCAETVLKYLTNENLNELIKAEL